MSQSGPGGPNGTQTQSQDKQQQQQRTGNQQNHSVQQSEGPTSQNSCQNGRVEVATKTADVSKPDMSNGFENRTIDYERFSVHERNQSSIGIFQQAQQSRAPLQYPTNPTDLPPEYTSSSQQTIQYSTLRRPSTATQPEERHPMVGQLLPQQYQPEKSSNERVQYVSQTSTQTLPVQTQPHFVSDYVSDQVPQYTQIRAGQFDVRSQIYSQQQQQQQAREYSDRAGYVTRDVTYREQAGATLYAHPQSTGNSVFTGTGPYVTVQHAGSQLPSQSTSPQPPYYTGVVVPSQPPPGYAQFATGQPQYPYSQYPQTVMNPIPYNPHGSIYQSQQFSQQSPNPQRFSQDMSQYQVQPIIQPIAQNVMTVAERPGGRGPKPMVPPRGNSKITHGDPGHRKSGSVDVPTQMTPAILPPKYEPTIVPNAQVSQEQVIRGEATLLVAGSQVGPDGQERRFLSPINQNPRTRQDGLYVDANGEHVTREKAVDTIASECGLYVSRSEHRKSVSVDVTTSFQRRNDTITFTFPGDNGQQDTTMAGRKTASLGDRKRPDSTQVFPIEARRVEPVLRVSPMTFDSRQDNRKSIVPERKPEWGNVSPNPRGGTISSQENRRSDYFEEHRRSPMTLEAKRTEDVRRSPMPFIPIRDPSSDRAAQKSPSFGNQNFEKTRQELAMWAEQRQRQELERGIHPGQIFSTSPRSRNQSEERRDPRTGLQTEEPRKDHRLSQTAFQPISNISQSSIMEQRRHLRHVSADLTKHMELSRKDFDDQPITGSVANLVPVIGSTVTSQRASPNICHQYPALSEAKLDTKTLQLTVVTDFGDNHAKSSMEHSDHIIHSHRKSQNVSTNLLTHSKSQADNLQAQAELQNDKIDALQAQQQQQQQQQHQQLQNQQMQNQQSLDMISEKLSQFERQQSDLQAKLQCLQNQNQILDKVAQFQHQTDLQVRFQCFQERQPGEKPVRQSTEYQPKNLVNEMHQMKLSPLPDHLLEQVDENVATVQDLQQQQQQQALNRQSLHTVPTYVSAQSLQTQVCQSLTCERLSPRLPLVESADHNLAVGQMTLPGNAQFERSDGARGSLQYRLACPSDVPSEKVTVATSTSGTTNVASITGPGNFTGTLKKVPPEKPPRTSLIVQSPESEQQEPASNRTQANTEDEEMDDSEIQSTVESILGPGVKVIDCEKKNCVREEEVLLINGVPISLEGPDGVAIREAMITGQIPPCDLLNQILVRAGILRAPVRLDTSLSVKSTVVTKEEVTVERGGKVVDERSRETKENNFYASSTSEIWEPVGIIHRSRNIKPFDSSDDSRPNSNASSDQGYTTNASNNHVLRERGGAAYGCPICEDTDPDCAKRCLGGLTGLGSGSGNKVPGVQTTTSAPTIFGTVASDLNPKDGNSRRECASDVENVPLSTKIRNVFVPNKKKNGEIDESDVPDQELPKKHNKSAVRTLVVPAESKIAEIEDSSDSEPNPPKTPSTNMRKIIPLAEDNNSENEDSDSSELEQQTSLRNNVSGGLWTLRHTAKEKGKSLPQTPAGGVSGKSLGGAGSASGMVNGAISDHQDIRDPNAINPEHALVYRDGNLVSGSLEALVQHMVPTEEYYPDRAYLFAFLLSARLFIKPHELLGEVCALCEHQQNLNGEGGKERLHRFVPRLVQLLAEWTETFPYDFRDERVMGHVRSITQKVAAVDAAARQEVSVLLQNLLLRLTALERYEEGLARLATEAATEQLTQVDVTELCPSATVLAQQLTHVELERLSYIGPEEFVQAFAKESPHLETSFKDMKKTRNLESYVQWFNRLSYFVATEVCKHAKKKQRVRVVEYWIETARECFNIGNFNSLMAIIAGLNMSPISRLKKTWSKIQSAKFSILEHQMDPSSNFSSYRSTLKAAMWRSAGATDERQRIVVPFFSLLVKDLYFLNEGCSNKLPNGHINFEKFWQLAKQVTEFIAWKQVACPFEKNSRVIAFLQASPVLTENALALASFECEPPDNNPEKERYKALKSELNAQ